MSIFRILLCYVFQDGVEFFSLSKKLQKHNKPSAARFQKRRYRRCILYSNPELFNFRRGLFIPTAAEDISFF